MKPAATFPDWKVAAEPYGDDPDERYLVTLVVGYHQQSDKFPNGTAGPRDAAYWALDLTRDLDCGSTVWHVFDRQTGEGYRFEQSDFDTREFDDAEREEGDEPYDHSRSKEDARNAYLNDDTPPEGDTT